MFKQLLIRKDYLLIAGIFILLMLGYQLAFRHTLEAWQLNHTFKQKMVQSSDITYQPAYLQRKNHNLDQLLAIYNVDTSTMRSNIINTISTIAENENVKLTEVPAEDVSYHTNHFIIEKLGFEGDFFSLLKLSDKLQSENHIGMVRAESWKKSFDRSRNSEVEKLVLEVYIEIYK